MVNKMRPNVKINTYNIELRKSNIDPNFKENTVLTDSTWHYVELYLKRQKGSKVATALNYWNQAKNFFYATENLDMLSKPLTSYYCFLNATKALLTLKNIGYHNYHGVSGKISKDKRLNILHEKVSMYQRGVFSGLCHYLNEPIQEFRNPDTNKTLPETYNLKDILYNLPYIHRAYNLTYANQPELFIPIYNPRFVHDKNIKEAWIEVQLEPNYSNKQQLNKLTGFSIDNYYDNSIYYTLRTNKKFHWEAIRNKPTDVSLENLRRYYINNRKRFRYIYSANDLWYIKRKNLKNSIIDRCSLTLTFAAMHRLSEMSRYNPNSLHKHLEKNYGWLLSEFITKSRYQFIDMISTEITGSDFRVTGFRT